MTTAPGPPPDAPVEETLASIRRVISEERTTAARRAAERPRAGAASGILELTREIRDDGAVVDIVTGEMLRAAPGGGRALEDLVEEAVEPAVLRWLDGNLPALVERLVAREVARQAGGGPGRADADG